MWDDRLETLVSHITRDLRTERWRAPEERIDRALGVLHAEGALSVPFIMRVTDHSTGAPELFPILVALGRGDLSVARLYEGHVNALQLLARYGTEDQLGTVAQAAANGHLAGVWGADDPMAPAKVTCSGTGARLTGRKTYASGADIVAHALVAVKDPDGKTQLVLLDRSKIDGRLDSDWWRPIGMQATNSFALSLDGLEVPSRRLVGTAGDYEMQPFFGAGAIRFVAAQLGGALALWDATRSHLSATRRCDDPHQAARLGQMTADLEAGFSIVQIAYARVAPAIAWDKSEGDPKTSLYADCARIAVETIAERVMTSAVRSIGCAGLMEGHPLAAAMRDLMVYLRQPAPDAALARVGAGACSGAYRPLFDAR